MAKRKRNKMKMKKKNKEGTIVKKDLTIVRKALAVAAGPGDSDISSYLPAPLANEVIAYIREINILRRLLRTFNMSARTFRKPKRNSAMSAYFIPDGVQATETGFTSTSLSWVAKKLMSYVVVDEEAIEDSQPDVVSQILQDFADAVAEAEERAFMSGDMTHAATAPDPTSATGVNWYVKDPRLAFDGIFTVAGGPNGATPVAGGAGTIDEDMVNKAIYNLGKYGRNKSKLIGLVPPEQAANIRSNSNFKSATITGLPLASFISGLGSAGEGDSLITVVYGVKMYEAPFAPAGQIAILDKSSPQIGDRRMIKLASDLVVEQDQRKYVVSERIAFNFDYPDAMCLIDDLSTTVAV
jgi:hypothetical protein